MNLGSISRTYDGRVALRFERAFPHAPEKVWSVITNPEYLDAWFPAAVEWDLTPGAQLQFRTTDEQVRRFGLPAGHTASGSVLVVHPGQMLELMWDSDVLHWELTPDGSGGCWLTLTHTTDTEDDAYAHGAGWHAGFEVVEAQLDGRPIDWSMWERAEELAEHYRGPGS
ncbi:uncharacterized protein YndB with AHSA1/START domain [Rhodococcus sp. SMB37]|uniref:SRPBCC family protein n=1 Tax=Rhodococcus sp. SMB37 TaxID=2512213 RepID=UPI0006D06F21|nr:SRPBCC family protein [Rhodococcus sp. SMB37]TCN52862.1 uncharacterized protein YndB with AHSA1/START domain [Rhodococcus sp. SMB37]